MTSELKNNAASISVYTDSFNKRIRIDDYTGECNGVLELILKSIPDWAEKIIIKARESELTYFQSNGFSKEAFIKGYFNGTDMHFLVKYLSPERANNPKQADEMHILENILKEKIPSGQTDTQLVSLTSKEDAGELASLYASVFKVYPTPLGNPDYIQKTMDEGTLYVVIREQGKITSAASAEINRQYSNAELTDCATLPEAQGKGHMKKLLSKLEETLKKEKIHCLYTIARSESYSMNKAFFQLNYTYGGHMINNCFIYSGLEDMNVWYKWIDA